MRILKAYDIEELQPVDERLCVAIDDRQAAFTQCAHCAVAFFQARWRRWKKVWFVSIRFHHWQTYAPWSNQIPPREPLSEIGRAYADCVVVGMQADEHGQLLRGKQTKAYDYYIRAEDTVEDNEVCHAMLTGTTMEFTEESQPPAIAWNRQRAREKWLNTEPSAKKAIIEEWTTWRGQGPKGNGYDKWEGPLNFPQVTITDMYNIQKPEYEQASVPISGAPSMETNAVEYTESTKNRIITNVSDPPQGAGQNSASTAESSCQYGSPAAFAAHAIPGGTAARVDEPRCYTVQGVHWADHGVITCVEPGSLELENEERLYQHGFWVFGVHHIPRWQMRKAGLIRRMRLRGFGKTQYSIDRPLGQLWPSTRATPHDTRGDWSVIIVDDYGSTWTGSKESSSQCRELHDLLTILGPSSKKSKLVQVSFRDSREPRLEFAFAGVGFWIPHPMQEASFAYVTQVKVVRYVLLATQMLRILHKSSNGVRGQGVIHHHPFQVLIGCLNYAYVYTDLSWFLIELIQDLWQGYKSLEWTQRGDPCLGNKAKGKSMVVNWMPAVGTGFRFPKNYMVQVSVTSCANYLTGTARRSTQDCLTKVSGQVNSRNRTKN
jgi:hypothetical protein